MNYAIQQYYQEVEKIIRYGGSKKETAIRNAFYTLLNEYAKQKDLMLVAEISTKTKQGRTITPDGTLKDYIRNDWGYWESKDENDDIDTEIQNKFQKGYPSDNILFEDGKTAVLYQQGEEAMRIEMLDETALHHILTRFISYERPEVHSFREAIEHFRQDIPKVAAQLKSIIEGESVANQRLASAINGFLGLCQASINQAVARGDVTEMMVQHILTAEIFMTVFNEPSFHHENNIARELDQVMATFFTGTLRKKTLSGMSHYYEVINARAAMIADHHEKQRFLKVVYENFYKGYNPQSADRLGIVYTPGEIVQFMIKSTDFLLHRHFGKLLSDPEVEILDPATGTGTFICDIIDFLPRQSLQQKYKESLHANELAILPYYIAHLNIEYTYRQKMGGYEPFDNLCFVDTLDNTGFQWAGKQGELFSMSAENTKRIKAQNEKKISVVIGNPPYNAKQENFNYQNANRGYPSIDKRIRDTFIRYGKAQNQIVVYDMYTRFYRWALDRLDQNGIIAFVTNRSFIDGKAFDGFRKIVASECNHIYIIDLGGDVRANPRLSGTKHNVFGIQTGVAIMFLVRKNNKVVSGSQKEANGWMQDYPPLTVSEPMMEYNGEVYYSPENARILYIRRPEMETAEEKLTWLSQAKFENLPFQKISPDKGFQWVNQPVNEWAHLIPLMDKEVKAGLSTNSIFSIYSSGVETGRDEWLFDFSKASLFEKVKFFIDKYNESVEKNNMIMDIKWNRDLENLLNRKVRITFDEHLLRKVHIRPFTQTYFYADMNLNYLLTSFHQTFFASNFNEPNSIIAISGTHHNKPFHTLAFSTLTDRHTVEISQCLPLYRYDKSGNRTDNITDWALTQFQDHYQDPAIAKTAIFHYVYAVLHNPAYREKYALNLKREFPRIPYYENFWQWENWGRALMELHINYETIAPYGLKREDKPYNPKPGEDARIALKGKLKADKENGSIILDNYTTLSGIPPVAWEYKLGNRSALEWVLDQYKEKKPSDPTIAEKFDHYRFADYKEKVIDLLDKVCAVSVGTMGIVGNMP